MDWKFVLIGLALLGLSAFAQAAYNPYINYEYGRPYYSQFYAYPGVSRAAQVYYGSYTVYSPYYYYRSPAVIAAPTYTVYTPPVIPVTTVVPEYYAVSYDEPVGLVSTIRSYGSRIGASFTVMFAG